MSKLLQFNEEALKSLLKGVKDLAKAVIATLGPRGRNVVIHRGFGSVLSTKDGVTVAKEIVLKDKFHNMGASLVKEAASKTSDIAGDGTTTAIVLAEAILSEGVKNVIAGANPMSVKRGIEIAVNAMCKALDALSTPVSKPEEVQQIATISANNDPEIGSIIAEAMQKVGKDGMITISESKGIHTELTVVEGTQFDKGYASPYFVTNAEKMSVEFENALILITDAKISNARDLVPILEKLVETGKKPLLIIADDIEGEALSTLVINKLQGGLSICAVKAPAFGDRRKAILQDIAILTGGTLISEEIGLSLEKAELSLLGKAKKIKVTKDETTLVDGAGDPKKVQERVQQIRREMERTTSSYDKEKLEERLAKLTGGVAVINVGAATEAEMKEKKARVEDALHATRAAVAEGVVPGGGVALLRAVQSLDKLHLDGDENVGVAIIRNAAFAPAAAIATNCGKQGYVIAEKIYESKEKAWGYNGATDSFGDLIKEGVIDPVKVTKSALGSGSSVSALLITVAAAITEKPKPKAKAQMPMGGGMGGPGMGGMGMDDMDMM